MNILSLFFFFANFGATTIATTSPFGQNILVGNVFRKGIPPQGLNPDPGKHHAYYSPDSYEICEYIFHSYFLS
jgi:hypothetical protein